MFIWAYGLLRVRTYYKGNHTYVNFHFGLCLTVVSGFLYPYQVARKTDLTILINSIFFVGIPLAIGQLGLVAGLALNKKSGQLLILSGIPVIVGYLVSYFRYGETIESMEMIGSILIMIGLTGVIYCGDNPEVAAVSTGLIMVGDPAKTSTQKVYDVLRIGS
jgi:drug/metabolite transporter (DMT)-like permease